MVSNISLTTFNVFGVPFNGNTIIKSLFRTQIRKRFRMIGKLLNTSTADIICLQEVYSIPHLNILKNALTNYPYCYYKLFLYAPRGGVVTFSKFPMDTVSYTDFTKKGSWSDKSIVGKISRRGLLITKFQNEPYYIINTHLTQNSDHDWSMSNRFTSLLKSQLDEVLKATELLIPNNVVIIAGDFNMPKKSEIYKEFMRSTDFFDVFNKYDTPTGRNVHIYNPEAVGRIDYIFITQNALIKKVTEKHLFKDKVPFSKDEKIYLSDHIGLHATINFEFTPLSRIQPN